MPKMKAHSGASKRFRTTAGGKLKHKQQGKNHIATTKSPKRVRDLRQNAYLEGKQHDTIKKMIQQ